MVSVAEEVLFPQPYCFCFVENLRSTMSSPSKDRLALFFRHGRPNNLRQVQDGDLVGELYPAAGGWFRSYPGHRLLVFALFIRSSLELLSVVARCKSGDTC